LTARFHEPDNVKSICCAEFGLREINILWDITQHVLGYSYQRFGETYCLYLQGEKTLRLVESIDVGSTFLLNYGN